jgi:hypothetical protein
MDQTTPINNKQQQSDQNNNQPESTQTNNNQSPVPQKTDIPKQPAKKVFC